VEKIAGMHVEPIDYGNVPGCTYMHSEIASVGLTEKQAKEEKGYELKIEKFPSQLRKAKASGTPDGFVKVILMPTMVNGWDVT
jgi:dihydrolipoamide dehydrogenase